MRRALLDFPWSVDDAFDQRSDCFAALLEFERLARLYQLVPVPFLTLQQLDDAERTRWMRGGASNVLRFVQHLIRHSTSTTIATPHPEPNPPLGKVWKQALREELEDDDWRRPQIVLPAKRRAVWPTVDEVPIVCEDRAGQTYLRVLTTLDAYEAHPFARDDFDPWLNTRHHHPPGANPRITHPCVLPPPLGVARVELAGLPAVLEEERRRGWQRNDTYCFIPPEDYDPREVDKHQWRKGKGFKSRRLPNRLGGPIDFEGRVWVWDVLERHWDVQLPGGGYKRISHDGRPLD